MCYFAWFPAVASIVKDDFATQWDCGISVDFVIRDGLFEFVKGCVETIRVVLDEPNTDLNPSF